MELDKVSRASGYSGYSNGRTKRETPGFKTHGRNFTFQEGKQDQQPSSSDGDPLRTSANLDTDGEEIMSLHSINSIDGPEAELKGNQRSVHTQTAGDPETARQHGKEVSAQTDIAYYDKRFVSKSKVKSLL